MKKQIIYQKTISTPLGNMIACSNSKGICFLDFEDAKDIDRIYFKMKENLNSIIVNEISSEQSDQESFITTLENQLKEYFLGIRKEFTLPMVLIGTEFQKKVWQELQNIPYGQTISYLQEAQRLNSPKAFRAVANANGKNKISILIPCHRVVFTSGDIGGYAGGLERKRFLLDLEKKYCS